MSQARRTVGRILAFSAALLAADPRARAESPPYEAQLLRLAEILGALHHLRSLCAPHEGSPWREAMRALLETDAVESGRRALFRDRFNRAYRAYAITHRACTPSAATAANLYLEEGARLAREVVERHAAPQPGPR